MPFKSEKQRRYLWAKEPEIAKKWANEEKKGSKRAAFSHLKKSHRKKSSK